MFRLWSTKNSGGGAGGGGVVTVALKNENLRVFLNSIASLLNYMIKKISKLTFNLKETIRCRFGMKGKHQVTKEQS